MENRIFIPGSEWVYFKLYTGTKTADAILKKELYGYVRKLLKNNIIDKWFFIRYSDPDFHIRLRLHLKETQDFTGVFKRFFETCRPLVDAGLVWNIQCDTYQREMERYGDHTISDMENLFFIDSEFVIKLLYQLDEDNPEQHRWELAMILIDSFLSACLFGLPQRKELLQMMSENYKKEFGFTQHQAKKQLDNKFRMFRKNIESVMLWENDDSEIMDIIRSRRQVVIPITGKLIAMEQSGELRVPMKSLLTSMIHMTMNRWFRSKNRLHELVIYDFLLRYYSGEIARKKYDNKQ